MTKLINAECACYKAEKFAKLEVRICVIQPGKDLSAVITTAPASHVEGGRLNPTLCQLKVLRRKVM